MGKIRVIFIIPEFRCGGAERTVINIVNHINRDKFVPILVVFNKRGPLKCLLHDDIEVISLNSSRVRYSIIKLSFVIFKVKPHVIMSTIRYVNVGTVFSCLLFRSKISVLVRETNDFTSAGINPNNWKEKVVGWCYRRAHGVIALSNGVRQDILERYNVAPQRVVTIYNPIDIEMVKESMQDSFIGNELNNPKWENKIKIVAVGSLIYQKGFDLLIRALAMVPQLPCVLWIIGDGLEINNLNDLTSKLGVDHQVTFLGFKENPFVWMSNADLFVLPSRWEGFGHVIVEAMVCGVPVLSTRCKSGPDEIISHGVNGLLCDPNSVSSLAKGIEAMVKNFEKRKGYVTNGTETVKRFAVRKIVSEYEIFFQEYAKKRSQAQS